MKRQQKTCFILFLVLVTFSSLSFTHAWADIVGSWSFDNCDGTDGSGNNNNGTLKGDPDCVNGVVGNALDLDGDGDYVEVTSLQTKDFTDLSICAWIYPITDGQGMIMMKGGNFDFSLNAYDLLVFGFWIGGGHQTLYSSSNIPYNQWTCVCVTYGSGQGGDGIKIYINGEIDNDADHVTSIPNTSDDPLTIGYDGGTTAFQYWDGKLDEVKLYDHVLTPSEIAAYCENGPENL